MTCTLAVMLLTNPITLSPNTSTGVSIEIVVALIGVVGIVIGGLFSKIVQAQFEKRKWKENVYNEYWQCFSRATRQGRSVEDLQAYAAAYSRLLLIASKRTGRAVYEIQKYRANLNTDSSVDKNEDLQNELYRAMRMDLLGWWRFPNLRMPKMVAATVSSKTSTDPLMALLGPLITKQQQTPGGVKGIAQQHYE